VAEGDKNLLGGAQRQNPSTLETAQPLNGEALNEIKRASYTIKGKIVAFEKKCNFAV